MGRDRRLPTTDDWFDHEERWLAPYAMPGRRSRGRPHPEPAHPYRSPYQRDRERVVHCSAFRRMTGKTQVLVASVNDHHRTRLTHTLEVTQVARTVARRLRLNEDLTEVIALAHDIGHPPFGHAGEDALNDCLAAVGGFDHNLYGLRRVDELEERYPGFPGLNLTFEVRESFVRHSKADGGPVGEEFRNLGAPLLEAQVVDTVDGIAYATHDADDALGLGLITVDDLAGVGLWAACSGRVRSEYAGLDGAAFRTAVVRELLARQVVDLLDETARRIAAAGVGSLADVRAAATPLVGFGPEMADMTAELGTFLRERVYRHHRVLRMTASGKRILAGLFAEYVRNPELLPDRHLRRWERAHEVAGPRPTAVLPGRRPVADLERVVGDYLAGMTDRFAQTEYRRLFHPSIDS